MGDCWHLAHLELDFEEPPNGVPAMKNVMALAAPVLMSSAVLADASGTYSWEDGVATIIGSFGNISSSRERSTIPIPVANHCYIEGNPLQRYNTTGLRRLDSRFD